MAEPKTLYDQEAPAVKGPDGSLGPDGSFLGKYYCRLILADYQRTRPFSPASWDIQKGKTIFLPLPRELSDDTSSKYSEETIEGVGDIINADPGFLGRLGLTSVGPILGGIAGAATDAGGGYGKLIAAGADNTGLNSKNITSALQSVIGYAPNPNPAVLFTGPELRDINFSWTFYPKNHLEAKHISSIIKTLKQASLSDNSASSTGVLVYPKLCQINFYPWDKGGGSNSWGWTNDSIIRIKKCFLSSVKASYSDFGNPAFFHSVNEKSTNSESKNYSVTYRLSITFKEVEYLLSRDWRDNGFNETQTEAEAAAEQAKLQSALAREGANLAAGLTKNTAVITTEIPKEAAKYGLKAVVDTVVPEEETSPPPPPPPA